MQNTGRNIMKLMACMLISILIHSCVLCIEWVRSEKEENPAIFVQKGASSLTLFLPELTENRPEPVKEEVNPIEDPKIDDPELIEEVKVESQSEKDLTQQENTSNDEGADSPGALIGDTKPKYPRISRERGEEGIVVLSVTVSPKGKCSAVKIVSSSGYYRLDRSALKWAKKEAQYTPGKKGDTFVSTEIPLRVPFRLTGRSRR
ncbi:energy transducer TonB [Planctomycetota bacterium]